MVWVWVEIRSVMNKFSVVKHMGVAAIPGVAASVVVELVVVDVLPQKVH